MICGSLTWLRDHKTKSLDAALEDTRIGISLVFHQEWIRVNSSLDDDEPAWVREHAKEERKKRLLREKIELEEKLAKIREKEKKEKEILERGGQTRKKQVCGILVSLESRGTD